MPATETSTVSSARAAYIAMFASVSDAIAFENQVLSVGREFLPAVALAVIEDMDAATVEYYEWLTHAYSIDIALPSPATTNR